MGCLEAAATLALLTVMRPWLSGAPLSLALGAGLALAAMVLHYRWGCGAEQRWHCSGGLNCCTNGKGRTCACSCAPPHHLHTLPACLPALSRTLKLDPGFLEAKGMPLPLTPQQRRMLSAQVTACPRNTQSFKASVLSPPLQHTYAPFLLPRPPSCCPAEPQLVLLVQHLPAHPQQALQQLRQASEHAAEWGCSEV